RAQAPVAFTVIRPLPAPPGGAARAARPASALRSDHVISELAPASGEYVLPKAYPSAFFGTPLLTWLVQRGVTQVILVGGATSGCVRATALDAFCSGLEVLLVADGCFDRVRTSHEVTLTDMDVKYARVVRSQEVRARLV